MIRLRLTKRERKGAVIFLIFIVSVLALKIFIKEPSESVLYTAHSEIASKTALSMELPKTDKLVKFTEKKAIKNELKDSVFDLNTIQKKELISLGIKEREASSLIKERDYRNGFVNKDQLDQLYGINEPTKIYLKRNAIIKSLDLNSVSRVDLLRFKGVGEKLSERIVKYRDILGGFCRLDQLFEVYGLDSTVVENMMPHLFVNGHVKGINLNAISLDEMIAHPYLDYKTAMLIIQKRSEGKLTNIDFLTGSMERGKLEKLKFYATF